MTLNKLQQHDRPTQKNQQNQCLRGKKWSTQTPFWPRIWRPLKISPSKGAKPRLGHSSTSMQNVMTIGCTAAEIYVAGQESNHSKQHILPYCEQQCVQDRWLHVSHAIQVWKSCSKLAYWHRISTSHRYFLMSLSGNQSFWVNKSGVVLILLNN